MGEHPLADALREAYAIIHALDLPVDHPQADALAALNKRLWQDLSQYEKSDTDRDQLREALQQARDYLLEVGNDYPGSSCQKWCTEKATEVWNAVKPWEHCPSTHCERTQECRSVNECAANKRAALASKTAIDPATVERCAQAVELLPSEAWTALYAEHSNKSPTALFRMAAATAIRALGKDQ